MKRRKMRKQITQIYNPYNFDLEVGDRVIDSLGCVSDLKESTGFYQRASGVLIAIPCKKPHPNAKAIQIEGIWYWEWKEE